MALDQQHYRTKTMYIVRTAVNLAFAWITRLPYNTFGFCQRNQWRSTIFVAIKHAHVVHVDYQPIS